jgi:hypothetical protein
MAAISTHKLALLKPGDVVLNSEPRTKRFRLLPEKRWCKFGITVVGFRPNSHARRTDAQVWHHKGRLAMIFVWNRQPHQPPRDLTAPPWPASTARPSTPFAWW